MKIAKIDWKSTAKSIGETLIYVYTCLFAYEILKNFGYLKELNFFWMVATWVITFVGGDFLIARNNKWLMKRKIMKVAKEIAKSQGINPKQIKHSDIKVTMDKDGLMDIEIHIDKKNEQ